MLEKKVQGIKQSLMHSYCEPFT